MLRLQYELRLLGWRNLGLLPAGVIVFLAVTALITVSSQLNGQSAAQNHVETGRLLLELLEFGLPPLVGFASTAIVTTDPNRELQLTLPTSYPATIGRRLGLFLLGAALVCSLTSAAIVSSGFWIAPQAPAQGQLIWAAPVLCFSATGALLALLLQSRAASSTILGLLWIVQAFFHNEFIENEQLHNLYLFLTSETLPGGQAAGATYWLDNRLTLIAIAGAMFVAAWCLLRRDEALLGTLL